MTRIVNKLVSKGIIGDQQLYHVRFLRNAAEKTLETLSQNTGGKAYVVPDSDDGSFMNDALQGSLTYQPPKPITNTDIKVRTLHFEQEETLSYSCVHFLCTIPVTLCLVCVMCSPRDDTCTHHYHRSTAGTKR